MREAATGERSAALHPEESEGLGSVSAIDAEADGGSVRLPPEVWCAAFWEEDAG